MTRREFARNTVGALFGVSVIPAAFEKPISPEFVCGVDPAYGSPYFTMTWGRWNNGKFEVTRQKSWGTPPPAEKICKIMENFKANLHDMYA